MLVMRYNKNYQFTITVDREQKNMNVFVNNYCNTTRKII